MARTTGWPTIGDHSSPLRKSPAATGHATPPPRSRPSPHAPTWTPKAPAHCCYRILPPYFRKLARTNCPQQRSQKSWPTSKGDPGQILAGLQSRSLPINWRNSCAHSKVSPKAMRIGDDTQRGYLLTDFKDAFSRFLPDTCPPKCNSVTNVAVTGTYNDSELQHETGVLHFENPSLPPEIQRVTTECCSVTVGKPPAPEKDDELLL